MLCLIDSIRDDDPSWQRLLSAVAEAYTLTELLLAAWPLACMVVVHLVESVLAERARRPTSWPRAARYVGLSREPGLCHAPGHQPVWADQMAPAGRPVAAGMCQWAGGPLR
jgi:hypothetical protein